MKHYYQLLWISVMALAVAMSGCNNKTESAFKTGDFQPGGAPIDVSDLLAVLDSEDKFDAKVEDFYGRVNKDFDDLLDKDVFAINLPEYVDSKVPFLANSQDYFNACALMWNVMSDTEIWYRWRSYQDIRCSDEGVIAAVKSMDTKVFRDDELRAAAERYKAGVVKLLAGANDDKFDTFFGMMSDTVNLFIDAIVERVEDRVEVDDEEMRAKIDTVWNWAEDLSLDRYQTYLDAGEGNYDRVILEQLAACKTFDEQCSLFHLWANVKDENMNRDLLMLVGDRLLRSGNYNVMLGPMFIVWRSVCQTMGYGLSSSSEIPNHYYNEVRKSVYKACLKHIEAHPDDLIAQSTASELASARNLERFYAGMGNGALYEAYEMISERHNPFEEDIDESNGSTE